MPKRPTRSKEMTRRALTAIEPTVSRLAKMIETRKAVAPEIACASVICGGYFYAMAHQADPFFCTAFAAYSLTVNFAWTWVRKLPRYSDKRSRK